MFIVTTARFEDCEVAARDGYSGNYERLRQLDADFSYWVAAKDAALELTRRRELGAAVEMHFVLSDNERLAIDVRGRWYQLAYPLPWEEDGAPRYAALSEHEGRRDDGKIAYYRDERDAAADRRTAVSVGTYLDRFCQDISAAERERRIDLVRSAAALTITTNSTEIARAYWPDRRPSVQSCMTNAFDRLIAHPCSVYGAPGDLALAYLGPLDNVVARAIVWPAKKIYGRIYSGSDALKNMLIAAGYRSGNFEGARIRRIRAGSTGVLGRAYLAPYVDGYDYAYASTCGQFWILSCDADSEDEYINTGNQCGYSEVCTGTTRYTSCDHCGERFDESDSDSSEYCGSCFESRWTCEVCDGTYFTDECQQNAINSRGRAVLVCSDNCAQSLTVTCPRCGRDHTDHFAEDHVHVRRRAVTGELRYCDDCENEVTIRTCRGGRPNVHSVLYVRAPYAAFHVEDPNDTRTMCDTCEAHAAEDAMFVLIGVEAAESLHRVVLAAAGVNA
jgi:hypothetical protein